ncbi:MAG: hypothetical protein AB1921_13530 [Thermodesulfobacteriota bacterium]
MKPYLQGSLDGLCGLYSIVNATRLVTGRMGKETAADLFLSCVKHLHDKGKLPEVIRYGMGVNHMLSLLRDVVKPAFPMDYVRPFRLAATTPVDQLWDACTDFLAEQPRAVILVFSTWNWSHWTVAWQATGQRLFTFDSTDRKVINRRHCTTSEMSVEHGILLYPAQTFFLFRK